MKKERFEDIIKQSTAHASFIATAPTPVAREIMFIVTTNGSKYQVFGGPYEFKNGDEGTQASFPGDGSVSYFKTSQMVALYGPSGASYFDVANVEEVALSRL